jgi:hypothetical protein
MEAGDEQQVYTAQWKEIPEINSTFLLLPVRNKINAVCQSIQPLMP